MRGVSKNIVKWSFILLLIIWVIDSNSFFEQNTASAHSFYIPIKYLMSNIVCLFLKELTPSSYVT